MEKYLRQAKHNEDFHECLRANFKDKFYDWKITCIFYISIHYLKALAAKRGIDIGATHREIEKNINPRMNNALMRISQNAWEQYSTLFEYSRTSRYDGFTDDAIFNQLKERDYQESVKLLEKFKKYISGQGISVSQ